MGRAFVALALVGCNQVYGLDGTELEDLEPNECSDVAFGLVETLTEFRGLPPEFDAQISSDGLELWFVRADKLFRATRPSLAASFVAQPMDLQNNQFEPAMTADGKRVMFLTRATPGGQTTVVEGVRRNPSSATFDVVNFVVGLGQFMMGVGSFDLSWDGLRVYYSDFGGELWTAHRKTRNDPFIEPRMLFSDAVFPSISGDELEIFYNDPDEGMGATATYRRSRATRNDDFSAVATRVLEPEAADPDVSPDGTQMVISDGAQGLSIVKRTCPD